jgi:serine/threonine protein kinase
VKATDRLKKELNKEKQDKQLNDFSREVAAYEMLQSGIDDRYLGQVAKVREWIKTTNTLYLVMEHCNGGMLFDLITYKNTSQHLTLIESRAIFF